MAPVMSQMSVPNNNAMNELKINFLKALKVNVRVKQSAKNALGKISKATGPLNQMPNPAAIPVKMGLFFHFRTPSCWNPPTPDARCRSCTGGQLMRLWSDHFSRGKPNFSGEILAVPPSNKVHETMDDSLATWAWASSPLSARITDPFSAANFFTVSLLTASLKAASMA